MSATFQVDGTVLLCSDRDPSITRTLPAGMLREAQDAAIKAFHDQDRPAATLADVEAERDRRIQAGVTFAGVLYQTRSADENNIRDSRAKARDALDLNGAKAGDLRWFNPAADFVWIAADNSRVPMDAQTMVDFADAVGMRRAALIFAASDLKARIAAGEVITNCTDHSLWPG